MLRLDCARHSNWTLTPTIPPVMKSTSRWQCRELLSSTSLMSHVPGSAPATARRLQLVRPQPFQAVQRQQQKPRRSHQPGCTTRAATAEVAEAPGEAQPATKQLRLEIAAKVIPHPDKASYGGEDAFFISNAGGGALGIADGVGGWQDSGINPAEYSRTFMRLACHYLESKSIHPVDASELPSANGAALEPATLDASSATRQDSEEVQSEGPERVADILTARGALAAAHAGTRLPGSTTACVVRLNRPHRTIDAANLGDSGFMLVRRGQVVFKSPVLQHFFDCPFQFGACPDYSEQTDSAEDAAVAELAVQPGDVILAGSDGLWDNCYDEELLPLLPDGPEGAQQAAGAIAGLAMQHAADERFMSPYIVEAARQGFDLSFWEKLTSASFEDGQLKLGMLRGGKVDDISCVVAVVVEEDVPEPEDSTVDSTEEALSEEGTVEADGAAAEPAS